MSDVNCRYFDALMAEKKMSLRGLAQRMGLGHSQLSLCKIRGGPVVVASARRGYADGSHNLGGLHTRENAHIDHATPVLLIRP